jgi:putative serine/threonine protein kinase
VKLSQHNVSFSDEEKELDIRSPRLLPLITYPRYSEIEYKDRIIEMESLGITSIILDGKTIVNSARVAGKGCVGIVVKVRVEDTLCALKIKRTDACRNNMNEEARFHKIANNVGVGPHLEGQTRNLIAMEYVPGQNIAEWVADTTKSKMHGVARAILEQCFRLDSAGIDHGELSRLTRHVIISDRPYIIDFESASTTRKTCNVTAAAQSIFLYGIVANRVRKILGNIDTEKVIHVLRTYKHFHTRANFDAVLDSLLMT